jgi:hypothetical protein
MPQTFTKQTTIVWDKNNSLQDLIDSDEFATVFNGKIAEMQKNLKMFMGTGSREEGETIITVKRRFADAESANEWIAFNQGLATTYNKTLISSSVADL